MTANDRAPPHGQNVTLWILVAIAGLASFAGILTIGIFTMPMVYGGAILLLVRPDRTRGVAIMLCAVAAPQYLWPGSTEAAQASSAILTRPTASRAAPNSTLGPGSEAQPPASLSPRCFSFTLGGATPPRSQAQRSRAAGAPRERRTKHERHTEADPWFTHIGVGFPVRGNSGWLVMHDGRVDLTYFRSPDGAVYATLGPAWPGFNELLGDAITPLPPIGSDEPSLSTYWIDREIGEIQ